MPQQHGIIGDNSNYGLDWPDTAGEQSLDQATANMARFSKSAEFKALKEKLEGRIYYYRSYQPGGNGEAIALRDLSNEERGWRSLASDLIIAEFQALLQAYELAAEQVKNETAKRKGA